MLKKKKTTASGKLVLVKSVRRTRSHRMKFCVQQLKAENQMEWVAKMNNIQACAREIVDKEIIFL